MIEANARSARSRALVSPKHVMVSFEKKHVIEASFLPADGEFDVASEPALYAFYELPYKNGSGGERRPGRR